MESVKADKTSSVVLCVRVVADPGGVHSPVGYIPRWDTVPGEALPPVGCCSLHSYILLE